MYIYFKQYNLKQYILYKNNFVSDIIFSNNNGKCPVQHYAGHQKWTDGHNG